jgi:hypothetical protein
VVVHPSCTAARLHQSIKNQLQPSKTNCEIGADESATIDRIMQEVQPLLTEVTLGCQSMILGVELRRKQVAAS